MLEMKQAFKGQISKVGRRVATIRTLLSFPSIRPKVEKPFTLCVRVEEETKDRLEKYCDSRKMKIIGVAGLILNAAINEFLDYDDSLKVPGETLEESDKEYLELVVNDYDGEAAKDTSEE